MTEQGPVDVIVVEDHELLAQSLTLALRAQGSRWREPGTWRPTPWRRWCDPAGRDWCCWTSTSAITAPACR